MTFSNLTADEMARIDAICLNFEAEFKAGQAPHVSQVIAANPDVDREALVAELEAVNAELSSSRVSTLQPTQPKTLSEPHDSVFRPGVDIGPYRIESLIGRGGMGRVYRGYDSRLARPVAIKVLADDWSQHRERVERFERESRAVAAMRHANIVSLYDVGSHAGRPYAVMELLEGETLRERIARGPMTPTQTRWIGAQIADALTAAHEAGIVHRDLKPENLFLIENSKSDSDAKNSSSVKLLDFGLSRAPEGQQADSHDPTASGIVMGTAGYMAPEQARGEKATVAADIFSLGCVLHECFYGKPPFPGKTLAESLGAVLHTPPVGNSQIEATDPDLALTILRCLEKDIRQRPSSAAEVARWLRVPAAETLPPTAAGGGVLANGAASVSPAAAHREAMRETATHSSIGLPMPAKPMLFSRRNIFKGIGGGILGAFGGVALWKVMSPPGLAINSLAVLPIHFEGEGDRLPLGDRLMSEEERLAMSVHFQLAKQPSLRLLPYRSMKVDASNYVEVGEELGVEGLVLVGLTGEGKSNQVNLQLVDTSNGELLWGEEFIYHADTFPFEQRSSATVIARRIGDELSSLRISGQVENDQAYGCLVNGEARLDPDSPVGMRESLSCFGKARRADPGYAEAHAGFALAALSIAGLTEFKERVGLIIEAREAIDQALVLNGDSGMVNLAAAMFRWRIDFDWILADNHFQKALDLMPNSWQLQHEYALYCAASRFGDQAVESASRAVKLNPLSLTLRIDAARIRWFNGDPLRAGHQTKAIRREFPDNRDAIGLLIDLHEEREEYNSAANLQGILGRPGMSAEEYYSNREKRLEDFPYGAFGPEMNRAILDARRGRADRPYIETLALAPPTSFALLMSAHPAFADVRHFQVVEDIIPPEL